MAPETAKTMLLVLWGICSVGVFLWWAKSPHTDGPPPSLGYRLLISPVAGGFIAIGVITVFLLLSGRLELIR
jgi:hypothetical protein